MHKHSPRSAPLRQLLLVSLAGAGLVATGAAARAASSAEMLRTAEAACLASASQQGWQPNLAKVVSSRSIDADKVEIVFDLSKDGVNTARLTCPYSASKGLMGKLGAVGEKLAATPNRSDFGGDFSRSMGTAASTTEAVNRSRAWWLLLPVGPAALCWAALLGREGSAGAGGYGHHGAIGGNRTDSAFVAEARSADGRRDGQVLMHELADGASMVRRRIANREQISLTGRRAHDWLELDGGGWVRDADLHYDRASMGVRV
ncbi:MAG: hypothetical protein ACKO6F_10665 [Cyanobium sp.]